MLEVCVKIKFINEFDIVYNLKQLYCEKQNVGTPYIKNNFCFHFMFSLVLTISTLLHVFNELMLCVVHTLVKII